MRWTSESGDNRHAARRAGQIAAGPGSASDELERVGVRGNHRRRIHAFAKGLLGPGGGILRGVHLEQLLEKRRLRRAVVGRNQANVAGKALLADERIAYGAR